MSELSTQTDTLAPRQTPVLSLGVAAIVGLVLLIGGFVLGRVTGDDGSNGSTATVETSASGDDPATLLQVALQLHRDGDLVAAEQAYLRVLELAPSDKYALYNLGLINQTRGELEAARDYYDRALAVDADLTSALYNRGLARRDLGDIEGAITDLRHLIELEPENAPGLFNLGNILIADGKVEEGTAMVAKATEIEPTLRGDV